MLIIATSKLISRPINGNWISTILLMISYWSVEFLPAIGVPWCHVYKLWFVTFSIHSLYSRLYYWNISNQQYLQLNWLSIFYHKPIISPSLFSCTKNWWRDLRSCCVYWVTNWYHTSSFSRSCVVQQSLIRNMLICQLYFLYFKSFSDKLTTCHMHEEKQKCDFNTEFLLARFSVCIPCC